MAVCFWIEEEFKENGKADSAAEGTPVEVEERDSDKEEQVFVAFARIFSGSVKKGKQLYVLGPKHDPARALEEVEITLFKLTHTEI